MKRIFFRGFLWVFLVLLCVRIPDGRSAASAALAHEPAKVLVAYYSRTGNTEQMAEAAAEGARRVPQVVVILKQIADVSKEDLRAADGIIVGCPTYFANIPGEMKVIIDDWNWKWKVDFTDKIGGAFATAGSPTGGQAHVVDSLLLFMLHNRMLVAGPLYQNEKTGSIWAEAGATAATGPTSPAIDENERDAARRLGERIARLAVRLSVTAAQKQRES